MIRPVHYLLLSVLLFVLGLLVAIVRRQWIVVVLGISFSLQAVTLAVAALTSSFQDWAGRVFTLVLITVSALPPLLGLAVTRIQHARRR
jgi:NADH-quinone oxidoreductase subunit K